MREPWLWSLPLASLGLGCQWLAGRHPRSAWLVGLADEALWMTYAALTRQWLFVASAVAYGSVYLRNLWSCTGLRHRRHTEVRRGDRRSGPETQMLSRPVSRRVAVAVMVPAVLGLAGCAREHVSADRRTASAGGTYAPARVHGGGLQGSASAVRRVGTHGSLVLRRRVSWRDGRWLVEPAVAR